MTVKNFTLSIVFLFAIFFTVVSCATFQDIKTNVVQKTNSVTENVSTKAQNVFATMDFVEKNKAKERWNISSIDLPYNQFKVRSDKIPTQERSFAYAREIIGRHLCMRNGIYLFTGRVEETIGKKYTDVSEYTISYDESELPQLMETVDIMESDFNESGDMAAIAVVPYLPSVSRIEYLGIPTESVEYVNKKPKWVTSPPKVPGYYTGIGVTHERRFIQDSLFEADMEAAQKIALQVKSAIRNYNFADDFQSEKRKSIRTKEGNIILSDATLKNFYVVDRWIDPNTKEVYSFAVAKN